MKALATATIGLVFGLFIATQLGTPKTNAGAGEAEAAKLYQQASQAIANKQYRKAAL